MRTNKKLAAETLESRELFTVALGLEGLNHDGWLIPFEETVDYVINAELPGRDNVDSIKTSPGRDASAFTAMPELDAPGVDRYFADHAPQNAAATRLVAPILHDAAIAEPQTIGSDAPAGYTHQNAGLGSQ